MVVVADGGVVRPWRSWAMAKMRPTTTTLDEVDVAAAAAVVVVVAVAVVVERFPS